MFLKESYRQIKYNKYMRKIISKSAGRYLVLYYMILFRINESKNRRSCTRH